MLSRKHFFALIQRKTIVRANYKSQGKKGKRKTKKKKKKNRNSEFDEPFSVSAQRNHSRTKVSRFKSGRATSSLSREFTAKTARARICTMRAYIVWTFVIMHATFVNIFSASVGSHSMTQTRVSRRAFWLRWGNYRLWKVHEESSRFSDGWK